MGSLAKMGEKMHEISIDVENAEKNRKEINDGTNGLIDRARRYTDAFKDYADNLKAWRIDEGFRRVHLRKGRNKILARVENGHWNFGWSICLTPDPSVVK